MSSELAKPDTCNNATLIGFDTSGINGTLAIFNALNGAVSLDDAHIDELDCVGIATRADTQVDPLTSVERPCIATTLIGSNGRSFFSRSAGIAKSARNLCDALMASFGGWPEGKTIKLVFKSTELAGKKTWKYFDAMPVD